MTTQPPHSPAGRDRAPLPPIKFDALAKELLSRAESLLEQWLPGGVRRGHEYVCGSVRGGEGTSCSVNLSTGMWADFSSGEKGGDLISLYAASNDLSSGKAAVQVARDYGLEDIAGVTRAREGDVPVERAPKPLPEPKPPKPVSDEGWAVMRPVPATAPAPKFWHFKRNNENNKDVIDHMAEYRVGGDLHGFVVRFLDSKGKKETMPYTWCISARDGMGQWKWKAFDEPKPLYFPSHALPNGRTVVLVEGEKKSDALQKLLDLTAPDVYTVASWVGGANNWKKADWSWLKDATVLLWPDCDAHREKLTKAEAAVCLDAAAVEIAEAMKPLLPTHKQPGMAAMLGIGTLLRDTHGCTVQMLKIPEPLEVSSGWDCGDAINTDGWNGERVLNFFGTAYALPLSKAATAATGGSGGGKKIDRPVETEGSGDATSGDDAFEDHLHDLVGLLELDGVHEIGVNRKLVIAALRKSPHLKGCLGLNELTGAPSTQRPWPWRKEAGPLHDTDDLMLGDWLCTTYKIKSASRGALSEAVDTVADQNRFHPIRDWLEVIKHDGKPRLDKWLIHIMGLDPELLKPKRRKYLELVGRFILMGLVARVMKPGCKFDYSPVFEGLTGRGKSTLVKLLVGKEFFSDTHFDIGTGKDGMEQLGGIWGYELSELTSLRKADSEQVKQFFSSEEDRYRAAYGKYVQKHPRQCLIFCSTNKRHYLYDMTGNRRFWPLWIEQHLNLGFVKKWRDQLFAEAFALYTAGEPYSPSPEEEELYFVREQALRLSETSVQSRLFDLLTRNHVPTGDGKQTSDLNQLTTFVTLDRLVQATGTDAGKSGTLLENQIKSWLEAGGWTYAREGGGQRRRGYFQPKVWPPKIDDEDDGLVHENTQALRVPVLPKEEVVSAAQAESTESNEHDVF